MCNLYDSIIWKEIGEKFRSRIDFKFSGPVSFDAPVYCQEKKLIQMCCFRWVFFCQLSFTESGKESSKKRHLQLLSGSCFNPLTKYHLLMSQHHLEAFLYSKCTWLKITQNQTFTAPEPALIRLTALTRFFWADQNMIMKEALKVTISKMSERFMWKYFRPVVECYLPRIIAQPREFEFQVAVL